MKLIAIVAFIVGVVIGISLATYGFKRLKIGKLRVDYSIPDEPPYLFLELSKDIYEIESKKQALVEIDIKNHFA